MGKLKKKGKTANKENVKTSIGMPERKMMVNGKMMTHTEMLKMSKKMMKGK